MPEVDRFSVVIAGAGVAGLEATLALRELAGDAVHITLLSPAREFVYRPMAVREPFAYKGARRHALVDIAAELGVELVSGGLVGVDVAQQAVLTDGGGRLPYDALLVATGARAYARYGHAITIDDSRIDDQLHGIVQDIEGGYVDSIAFVSPPRPSWPLPVYELALMSARRAYDMNVDMRVTIATPEATPLALFGDQASQAVAELLEERGIEVICRADIEVPEPRRLLTHPGPTVREFDRIVALPELVGPGIEGLPADEDGFLEVTPYGQVRGVKGVYAAGDAISFPVKHGGLSAQQADAAATAIAASAGADLTPEAFVPVLEGMLLTGGPPLYLSARLIGSEGFTAQVTRTPKWSPTRKIFAERLATYLEGLDAR